MENNKIEVLVFYAEKAGSVGKGMYRSATAFIKDRLDLSFLEKFSIMYYPNGIRLSDPEDNRQVLIHPGEYLLFYEHYQKNTEKKKQAKQTKFLRMAYLDFENLTKNDGIRIINKRVGIKKVYIDIYPPIKGENTYRVEKLVSSPQRDAQELAEEKKEAVIIDSKEQTWVKNVLITCKKRSQAAIANANLTKFCTKNEKYNCNAVMKLLRDFTIEQFDPWFGALSGGKRKRRRTMRKRRRHSTTRRHKKRRRRTHKKHRRKHTKGR